MHRGCDTLCSSLTAHGTCRDKEDVQETRGFASGRTCRAISTYWWVGGLVLSAAFCTAVMTPLLHMRVYEPLAAVVLALLVAVLAVRALGQTDLNPVSGVGKLSQVGPLLTNLILC